jgi:flagellar protein FliO/FliZ
MIELTVRLVASLAIVVGLLLLTVRLGGRRFRPRAGAPLRIVHRQALSRSSSLAVVEVGSRVLVLGTTEHQINVLAELGQDELPSQVAPRRERDAVEDHDDEVIDMEAVRRSGSFAVQPVGTDAQPFDQPFDRPATASFESILESRTNAEVEPPLTHTAVPTAATGPLAGSVLSADTWRQAFAVATGRSR